MTSCFSVTRYDTPTDLDRDHDRRVEITIRILMLQTTLLLVINLQSRLLIRSKHTVEGTPLFLAIVRPPHPTFTIRQPPPPLHQRIHPHLLPVNSNLHPRRSQASRMIIHINPLPRILWTNKNLMHDREMLVLIHRLGPPLHRLRMQRSMRIRVQTLQRVEVDDTHRLRAYATVCA